jgi:hypothetical protein
MDNQVNPTKVANILRNFHRNSVHPEADGGHVDAAVDAIMRLIATAGYGWNTFDHLCESKARDIAGRGYSHVGYVLRDANGDYCIINGSAVRWLNKHECWKLMHPDAADHSADAGKMVPFQQRVQPG